MSRPEALLHECQRRVVQIARNTPEGAVHRVLYDARAAPAARDRGAEHAAVSWLSQAPDG